MRIISFLSWLLPVIILVAVGRSLILYSEGKEKEILKIYETYEEATREAMIALTPEGTKENYEKAYYLYLQSAYQLKDPKHKAIALYAAANIGWIGQIKVADYKTLVSLYQQALRFDPSFYEAAYNLEYLYWIKANKPEEVPKPEPGNQPSDEGEPTSGDI